MAREIDQLLKPATNADVAGVAIDTVLALRAVQGALFDIAGGKTSFEVLNKHIEEINEQLASLNARFDTLTGWTKDER